MLSSFQCSIHKAPSLRTQVILLLFPLPCRLCLSSPTFHTLQCPSLHYRSHRWSKSLLLLLYLVPAITALSSSILFPTLCAFRNMQPIPLAAPPSIPLSFCLSAPPPHTFRRPSPRFLLPPFFVPLPPLASSPLPSPPPSA